MKKILIIVFAFAFTATSCKHMFEKKNIIRIKDNHSNVEIVYSGDIEFNEGYTAIENMSPQAYLTYKKNHRKIKIEKDPDGEIIYTLNNGHEVSQLDDEDKAFLTEALQEIRKTKHH